MKQKYFIWMSLLAAGWFLLSVERGSAQAPSRDDDRDSAADDRRPESDRPRPPDRPRPSDRPGPGFDRDRPRDDYRRPPDNPRPFDRPNPDFDRFDGSGFDRRPFDGFRPGQGFGGPWGRFSADRREADRGGPDRLDPAADAWVRELVKRTSDRNELVRRSAQRALEEIGRPALPALRQAARENAEAADTARRLIGRLEGGAPPGPDQQRGRDHGSHEGPIARLRAVEQVVKDLDLSEKQKGKVAEIRQASMKKAHALFQKVRDGDVKPEDIRSSFKKIHEEGMKEMKGVLSEEQYKKFEEAVKKIFSRGGPRRGASDDVPDPGDLEGT